MRPLVVSLSKACRTKQGALRHAPFDKLRANVSGRDEPNDDWVGVTPEADIARYVLAGMEGMWARFLSLRQLE